MLDPFVESRKEREINKSKSKGDLGKNRGHSPSLSKETMYAAYKGVEPESIKMIEMSNRLDRRNSFKQVYKTNIPWGGGAKEHPGKRRDPRQYCEENNNYKLGRQPWTPFANSRSNLLEQASFA